MRKENLPKINEHYSVFFSIIVAHEPSSASCSLLSCGLIETAELMDEDAFLEAMEASDCIVVIWVVVI